MKGLKGYLNRREEAILLLLAKPAPVCTPATFHQLRVEIKKLRALFELINHCAPSFKQSKNFKPFRVLFRQAGKVREIQVEEGLLKKYFTGNTLQVYRNSLKQLRLKERHQYFSLRTEELIAQLRKNFHVLRAFLPKVTKKKLNVYLEKQRKEIIVKLRSKKLPQAELHELRKRLKTFTYNSRLSSAGKQTETFFTKIRLTALLGQWHDDQLMLLNFQKAIRSHYTNQAEVKRLKKVKARILAHSRALLKQVRTAIQKEVLG